MAAILHRAIREKAFRERLRDKYLRDKDGDNFADVLELPKGWLEITDTVTELYQRKGGGVVGSSVEGTKIVLGLDNPAGNVFDCIGTARVKIGNFNVKVEAPCESLVRLTDEGGGSGKIRSTGFIGEPIFVDGNGGLIQQLINIDQPDDGAKNDHHKFTKWWGQSYAFAGARLAGQAAVATEFIGCTFQGRDIGQYGIYAKDDTIVGRGGQFIWSGGTLMEHQVADIRGDWRNGSSAVYKPTCEQSARYVIVDAAGTSFSGHSLLLCGGEWVNNSGIHPADGEIIQCYAGSLNIVGGTFGQNTTGHATTGLDYRIRYQVDDTGGGVQRRLGFNVLGLTLWTRLTSGHFPATAPDSTIGSWRRTGTTDTAPL